MRGAARSLSLRNSRAGLEPTCEWHAEPQRDLFQHGVPRHRAPLAAAQRDSTTFCRDRAHRPPVGEDLHWRCVAGVGLLLLRLQALAANGARRGPAEVRGDCACSDAPLVLCPPRQPGKHDPASRPSYEPAGFINFAGVAVDVYVLGGRSVQGAACETKLASLQPAEQVHFASWAGQTFRIRRRGDSGNQQLLQQHIVGEVHIRDCEPPGRPVHGLPVSSTAEAEAEAGVGAEAGAEAEARGAAACMLKASAALAEHRRWSRSQLERLTEYLVKERQRRDEERSEQQARVEQLERTVAALVARLDIDGLNDATTTGTTEEPLPWQPQPRGYEGADAPRSETSDQAASLATESGGDGSKRTQVEVDAVGGTHVGVIP